MAPAFQTSVSFLLTSKTQSGEISLGLNLMIEGSHLISIVCISLTSFFITSILERSSWVSAICICSLLSRNSISSASLILVLNACLLLVSFWLCIIRFCAFIRSFLLSFVVLLIAQKILLVSAYRRKKSIIIPAQRITIWISFLWNEKRVSIFDEINWEILLFCMWLKTCLVPEIKISDCFRRGLLSIFLVCSDWIRKIARFLFFSSSINPLIASSNSLSSIRESSKRFDSPKISISDELDK